MALRGAGAGPSGGGVGAFDDEDDQLEAEAAQHGEAEAEVQDDAPDEEVDDTWDGLGSIRQVFSPQRGSLLGGCWAFGLGRW